ncbi:MAG: sulfite exporter TauE/SafE family protein [Planctomycetota bacterium]
MPEPFILSDYLFWLALIGFASGFLDSIVGGGGLIGTPAMLNLFPGWSILNVVGTNRTSSICGTSLAAWNYFRTVRPESHLLVPGCLGAFAASFLGVQLAQLIHGEWLKLVVLGMIIALAIYSGFKRDLGQTEQRRFAPRAEGWAALVVSSLCGFYNGLIGPGTGTLLVFGFVSILGLDFLRSSAVSKAVNGAGDLSSCSGRLGSGYVIWAAAIPLVIANLAGSYVGSRLAILKGSRFIRRFFLIVVFGLIARLLWQLFSS